MARATWLPSCVGSRSRAVRAALLLLALALGLWHSAVLAQPAWIVAASDGFDDPSKALLPRSSPDPAHVQLGYLNGEYQIAITDPTYSAAVSASPAGSFDDVLISVDVRIEGDAAGRAAGLSCRRQPDGSDYRLIVLPFDGRAFLWRFDGAVQTDLAPVMISDVIRRDNQSNHLDLQCAGATITATINGTQVASVQDGRYATGPVSLQATRWSSNREITVDARFDKLVIFRPASAAAPVASQSGAATGPSLSGWTLATADMFADPTQGVLPRESPDPRHYEIGYAGGEYRIAKIDASYHSSPIAYVPATRNDVMVSADVRLVGETNGRFLGLICRRQADGSQYRLELEPFTGTATLTRWDGNVEMSLAPRAVLPAVNRDTQTNHLDLQCLGNTITGYVNGTLLGPFQDAAYHDGQAALFTGNFRDFDLIEEARFSNLVIYRPSTP